MSYLRKVAVYGDDGPAIDAFDRLRVSNPQTLFDSKQLFDAQPLLWDDQTTSGSAASSHSTATASSTISVSATTAGTRVRQTFRRFNYQPGKSQLILLTGVLDKSGGGTGITRRMGYFDDNNGIFLEDSAGTIRIVRRTSTSGSPVDDPVAQSSWNVDKLDGTGASGITLDFSKTQILLIDFEWLGVGRVRVGFVVDGIAVICHEMNHANSLSLVYMSSPNLPLRYEITNSGAGAASSLEHICATVISEGGADPAGLLFSHSNANTAITAASAGTLYALVGLKQKTTHLACSVLLESLSVLSTSVNKDYEWRIVFNPTVAGVFTYSDLTNSCCQIATGVASNTVTGGQTVVRGYATASAAISLPLKNARILGAAIDGTRDSLVLCVNPLAANVDVLGALNWRELL